MCGFVTAEIAFCQVHKYTNKLREKHQCVRNVMKNHQGAKNHHEKRIKMPRKIKKQNIKVGISFFRGGPGPFFEATIMRLTEVQNVFLISHYDVSDRLGYV